jgi:hypothetical protein
MSEAAISGSPRYQSLLVELLRTFPGDMILSKGVPYVVQVEDQPVRQATSPLDHLELLNALKQFNYAGDLAKCAAGLQCLSTAATDFLRQAKLGNLRPPLQIDIVVSASELGELPLELARDEAGQWLLGRVDFDVELTRRIRLPFAHRSARWQAKPRILLITASPPGVGNPVPVAENKRALRTALFPWIEPLAGAPEAIPDERDVLEILPNACLASIKDTCDKSAKEGKPFTHIHILAHGTVVGYGQFEQFGIALHGADGGAIAAKAVDLVEAFKPIADTCLVVTLAVCHGGADINPILPGSSLAHGLHAGGIPVVICSQFPLTFPGSAIFTEQFYSAALRGEDVRAALHTARVALKTAEAQTYCDWAALVGYVRLPEGYTDHLIDVALEANLASLRTAQSWFDQVIAQPAPIPEALQEIALRITSRIDHLKARLNQVEGCGRQGVLEENLGLLGSAEKRLAEVYFKLGQIESSPARREDSKQALERSLAHYEQSFRHHLSHHWTGVQMLSLQAVTTGKIAPKYWYAAVAAAEAALEDEKEYWAAGSLLELYLLAIYAEKTPGADRAVEYANCFAARVAKQFGSVPQIPFPIETTVRQLERYRTWWTTENGLFPGSSDLAVAAAGLTESLRSTWKLSQPLGAAHKAEEASEWSVFLGAANAPDNQ